MAMIPIVEDRLGETMTNPKREARRQKRKICLFAVKLTVVAAGAALAMMPPLLQAGGRAPPAVGSGGTVEAVANAHDTVQLAQTAPKQNAGANTAWTQAVADRSLRIAAPSASVNVHRQSARVHVQAPSTDVKVDPDRGAVRVRAPYVNVDIRW
jgi:hypothetical protein